MFTQLKGVSFRSLLQVIVIASRLFYQNHLLFFLAWNSTVTQTSVCYKLLKTTIKRIKGALRDSHYLSSAQNATQTSNGAAESYWSQILICSQLREDQWGMSLSLMADASDGKGGSGASGLQGVWHGRETVKRLKPVPCRISCRSSILTGFFSALYSKSSNCIIFQAPCFCLSVRLAPLIKLMEK